MWGATKYHLRHLADFSGRDARQTFWFWFLFLFIANTAASFAWTIPLMAEGMAAGVAAAQHGDPDTVQRMVMAKMADRMGSMMWLSMGLGIANLLLIAASFTRRVHDTGRSGLWAGAVGAVYLASLAWGWSRIDEATAMMHEMATSAIPVDAMQMQARMGAGGLIGYVPLILMFVFGIMKSDPGPNRYGEEPVRF